MKNKSVPFMDLARMHGPLQKKLEDTFSEILRGNSFILGKKVENFEESFANFCGTDFCAGTANGLDAIYLSLRALNIGAGDEVIVPSNTYIASALAVSYTGAKPVFVEPRESTYNLNPEKIEIAITEKTKAILPVHLYGQACEMDQILSIAKKYNLKVVEDNAQAQGAMWKGKRTGAFGDINATSFYPSKNIGALGDGGAITTNNESLFHLVKRLRNYGSEKKYFNEEIGINSRLDELQAALLSVKLPFLDQWNDERKKIAAEYSVRLKNTGDLVLPVIAPGSDSIYHVYVVLTKHRDQLAAFLASENIATVMHYPLPIHLQKAYLHLNFKKGDFPIAEKISETCLSLPMFPGLKAEEIEITVDSIQRFYRNA